MNPVGSRNERDARPGTAHQALQNVVGTARDEPVLFEADFTAATSDPAGT